MSFQLKALTHHSVSCSNCSINLLRVDKFNEKLNGEKMLLNTKKIDLLSPTSIMLNFVSLKSSFFASIKFCIQLYIVFTLQ